ncbi:MAG: putative S-layer protein [Candidatus Pacearchaeota archaeon]|nr:putative S-layer protein [Candidatus Pacearchaeota archaeon]
MSSKRLGLFALSVFTLLFAMGMASAAITLNPVTYTASINQGSSGSFTFTIFNDGGTGAQTVQNITIVSSNLTIVSSNLTSGSNILQNSQVSTANIPASVAPNITSPAITVTIAIPSGQTTGLYAGIINVDGVNNPGAAVATKTITLSINVTSSTPTEITTCTATGNPGDLKIKKVDFTNNGLSSGVTFGEDDQWFPFEEIEAEVQVKNDGNDDLNNIELDWGIYNTKTNEWVIEMDNLKEFDLKDGDTKTITIPFIIDDGMDMDLSDLSDGENYKFYVTATGEVDNDTAPSTCATDFKSTSIIIESDFVILDNIQMPETASCGESVTVTADVWNIGDNDQDSVTVDVFGKESTLKLDQSIDAGDINAFDKQEISFTFTVPGNLDEKTYLINFEVKDEDGNTYQNDFDDDESVFSAPLKVSGSCSLESQIAVAANIASGGYEGQELVVKVTITNNADEQKTYTLSAAGFEDWASASSLDQSSIILNAGESKDVLVTLDVSKNTAGSQIFFLVMTSGNEVLRQPVTVSIQEAKGLFGMTGNVISGSNWYVWALGVLILILILVIILVAVRVGRK